VDASDVTESFFHGLNNHSLEFIRRPSKSPPDREAEQRFDTGLLKRIRQVTDTSKVELDYARSRLRGKQHGTDFVIPAPFNNTFAVVVKSDGKG